MSAIEQTNRVDSESGSQFSVLSSQLAETRSENREPRTENNQPNREWLWIGLTVAALALAIPALGALFGAEFTYTLRVVALGGAVLGLVSGALGSFAVLRQQSLMGDALSHAALPGIAIAFLISGRELSALLIGAGVASWLGILLIRAITTTTRIKQDAAMGMVLAAFFALGLALLAYIQGRPDASQAGLKSFIFGQAAAMVEADVQLIALVGVVALGVVALFWKEFKLLTFDTEFARTLGLPTRGFDLALSTLTVIAIVLGLQLAGVILMVGLLIAPAVAARQWTQRLGQMVVLAGVLGAFAGSAGAVLSGISVGLPTGPLIIVVASALAFGSLAFAPGRGIVWTWLTERRDKRAFAAQHVLDDLARHAQSHNNPYQPTDELMLVKLRGETARGGLRDLERDGLAEREGAAWRLTAYAVEKMGEERAYSEKKRGRGEEGEKEEKLTHGGMERHGEKVEVVS
jgi:manganese/zinc/iron transport system permease protein